MDVGCETATGRRELGRDPTSRRAESPKLLQVTSEWREVSVCRVLDPASTLIVHGTCIFIALDLQGQLL